MSTQAMLKEIEAFSRKLLSKQKNNKHQNEDKNDTDNRYPYPKFKTTFWEEPKYNPFLRTKDQQYCFNYAEKEQAEHWQQGGHIFGNDERLVVEPPNVLRGPMMRKEVKHCFEKGEKYYRRTREINPLQRAKMYTRPRDRKIFDVEANPLPPAPTAYNAYQDMWITKPVCGVIK